MLIFFGTRSTKIQSQKVTGSTECPYCSAPNTFIATTFGTYFHIFWIPIITLGRRTVVECSHCKKTYDEKELPANVKAALDRTLLENPPKKALWHCLGCFVILGAIGLFIILLIYAIIFKAVKEDDFETYEDDYIYEEEDYNYEDKVSDSTYTYQLDNSPKWEYQLRKDMLNTDYSPNIENDRYSYALKLCLDEPSLGLDPSTTGYYSKLVNNKFLIFVEAEELNSLSDQQKEDIYDKITVCLDDILGGNEYQRYIGIVKNKTFYIMETPDGVFKDEAADNEKLSSFYNTENE
jgi:uncharacterized Zn-finger protein